MRLTEAWIQDVLDREFEDLELVLLEQSGNRRRRLVRLYVDHPEGVSHDLCARVSTVVGRELDEEGFADGPYTLEVSSPGVERPLTKRDHFERQVGQDVYVKTYAPVDGQKVWQGRLLGVGDEAVTVEVDGREAKLTFDNIAKAHVVFDF